MDQPGKVASPARVQLNRKNEYFPVHTFGPENLVSRDGFGSPVPRDPLTFVPLCDHKRDWHLIGLWLTCCVTVVSSVARTMYVWSSHIAEYGINRVIKLPILLVVS